MSEAAFLRAKEKYSWEVVIEQFDLSVSCLISKSTNIKLLPSGKLHSMHFGKVFDGYASSKLSVDDKFRTSFYGRQTLSGLAAPVRYDAIAGMVSDKALSELLETCLPGISLADIRKKSGMVRAQTDALVLWAIKQGLIERELQCLASGVQNQLSDDDQERLVHAAVPDIGVFHDRDALVQSVSRNFQQECERILGHSKSGLQFRLRHRYLLKRLIMNARGLRLLASRWDKYQADLGELFSLKKSSISDIQLLTADNYLGACRIILDSGIVLVYKPVSGKIVQKLFSEDGLVHQFNQWCDRAVFAYDQRVFAGNDHKGEFHFRLFQSDRGLSSSNHLYDLGLFSAFALAGGMSDLHLDNLKAAEEGLLPVDFDMFCHPEVLGRLHKEICREKLPPRWQESSLAITRIELLWDELIEHGWILDDDDIEEVIDGFQYGMEQVVKHASEWSLQMSQLAVMPCRDDPVPYNSACPILEQLETYGLDAVTCLKELKEDLTVQARRELRQLGHSQRSNELVSQVVRHWLSGCHYSEWAVPGKETCKMIKELKGGMEKRPGKAISWLVTLYREWLMHKNGLHD